VITPPAEVDAHEAPVFVADDAVWAVDVAAGRL
jgi:hypothetical protein